MGRWARRSGRIPVRTHLRCGSGALRATAGPRGDGAAARPPRRLAAFVLAAVLAVQVLPAAPAVADAPLPAPRPADAAAAATPADAAPPASVPVPAGLDDPFAMPAPAPKSFGATPVLPAGLTPAAVAAAAARRSAPPGGAPVATVTTPPPAPAGARPAAPSPEADPTVAEAPTTTAAAPPLPLRRPASEVATVAPPEAAPAAPAPPAEATAAAPPAAADPATAETPAVVAGAAPALPRPAPARAAPPATTAAAAGAAPPAAPGTSVPPTAEPPPAEPPATLAYAPSPGEATPPIRWTGREGKLPPASRAPTVASPPAAAVTPPPTPPGAPAITTAPPDAPAPAALPTVARPTSADCSALLALGPAVVEEAPDLPKTGACGIERPVRLKALKMPDGRLVALSPAAELRCDMAAATTQWLRDDLVPALEKTGTAVTAVKIADDYSCRPRNRVKGARMSEHGRGNAIDIGGFKLADGRVLEVAGNGLPKPFRITMRATACARFKTILGPGSDGYHENHIHVDLAERRLKRSYCRWRIPGTDAS